MCCLIRILIWIMGCTTLRPINQMLFSRRNLKAYRSVEFLEIYEGCYPNAEIIYKILLTIPATVASAERNFSKLKLIKSYFRWKMLQKKLNDLTISSIEIDIVNNIDYDMIIDDASKRPRRSIFRINYPCVIIFHLKILLRTYVMFIFLKHIYVVDLLTLNDSVGFFFRVPIFGFRLEPRKKLGTALDLFWWVVTRIYGVFPLDD